MNMCDALAELGNRVELFAYSKNFDSKGCQQQIGDFYGVDTEKITVNVYHGQRPRGIEFGIAIYSLTRFLLDSVRGKSPQKIISRNLYAAFFLGIVFRKNIIYETHSPEYGVRRGVQFLLLRSDKVKTIAISNALKKILCDFHGVNDNEIHVFHDAAKSGKIRINHLQRLRIRGELMTPAIDTRRYKKMVGYFGHLYPGRGIEVVRDVAQLNPSYAFVVYGGNEEEIARFRDSSSRIDNLFFMGYITPNLVHNAMSAMDVLFMPYQKSVSIGLKGVDTAKWMSPMKMFEYMSAGVPIVSSDLPVLREVLRDSENCLLVTPNSASSWSGALRRIIDDKSLSSNLGDNAYFQYKSRHTWAGRAEGMLRLLP